MTWGIFRCVAGVALVALGVPLAVLLFAVVCTPTNAGPDGVPWFRAFVFLMLALPIVMVWGGVWMYRAGLGIAEAQREARYRRNKEWQKAAAKAKVRRPKKHWQDDDEDAPPPRPRAGDSWSRRNRKRGD